MLKEGETSEEHKQAGGEICCRFSSSRRLHSIPDVFLLPLAVSGQGPAHPVKSE